MNNSISKSDFISILQETILSGKDLSFTPTGISMKPMLNGTTDTVILTKKPDRLKKYDLALYIRKRDNALVLHRVMRADSDVYIMSGDNQYYYDYDIPYNDILAVVKSIKRNGKSIAVDSLYYHVLVRFFMLRKYTKIAINKLKLKFKN